MGFQPTTSTAQEVIDRVVRQFGDEAAVQVTTADILRYINDGQAEINRTNKVLKGSATGNVIGNQDAYEFPGDQILSVQSIRFKGVTLQHTSMQEAEQWMLNHDPEKTGKSDPMFWYEWAGKFYLYPIPPNNITSGLSILYLKPPVKVTAGSDVLSLPDIYFQVLVDYCMAKAYEMDEDWEAHTAKNGVVAQGLQVLMGDDRANAREYPSITVLPEDY